MPGMSLNPPNEQPVDLSIPEEWKGDPPTLEDDPAAVTEPETHMVKGRHVLVVAEGEPKPTVCVHGVSIERGYWCGECQDESGRRQAKADKALRERRRRERAERELGGGL